MMLHFYVFDSMIFMFYFYFQGPTGYAGQDGPPGSPGIPGDMVSGVVFPSVKYYVINDSFRVIYT